MHYSTEKGTQMGNQRHTIRSPLHRLGVAGSVCSRTFQGIGALIAVLGSLVLAAAPAQAAIAHKYVSSLTGEPSASFGADVCGVTVDPATGDVYVADRENNAIDIFAPAGAGAYTYKSQISGESIPFGSFGNAFPQAPCSVAVSDVTGDVYFAGSSENGGSTEAVFVFNDLGDWIKTINGSGTPKEGGTPQGSFGAGDKVANVAIDQSSGEFYVSSSHYELVDRFNSANEYQSQFSAPDPNWLSGSSGGDIYDYSDGDVYEFNSSGSQIAKIAVVEQEENSIAVGAEGDVYVSSEASLYGTSQETGRATPVDQYNPAGELEGETRGTPSGTFSKPESVAVNSSGDLLVVDRSASGFIGSPGAVDIFGAGVLVPGTTAQAPSDVKPTTAVLNGSINPAGQEVTSCEFEYGTSTSYGQSVPCGQTAGSGTSPVAVTAQLGGLQPDTTYHYRLNAANADGGNTYEAGTNDEVFTTPGVPRIDSESAEVKSTEKAGQTYATLKARITPDTLAGYETTYQFEYGETEHYGVSIPVPAGDAGSGQAPVSVEAALSGLKVGTTYHYRVVAENEFSREAGKAVAGPDQTFTTVAAVLIEGTSVSNVTDTSATLGVQVNPLGVDTRAHFQYGTVSCATSPASCTDTPEMDVGSAEGYQALSVHLQDLTPSTVYYYRVIAANALGMVESEHNERGEEVVHSFTTQTTGSTLVLPDDRQWELVSPPNKYGASIPADDQFEDGLVEAAADGNAFTYVTTSPTEAEPGGYANFVQDLSTRSSSGWSSTDIATRNNVATGVSVGNGEEYRFFSPDLSRALVEPGRFTAQSGEETSPGATERTPYVRENFTCHATPATCYTPLLTEADVTTGAKFENQETFVGATPDLDHVVLEAHVPLTETIPEAEGRGLYEWSADKPAAEQLQLISVLPPSEGGAPATSSSFGSNEGYGSEAARNAISEDGSRVIFSAVKGEGKALYMRDTAIGETVRLDAVQGGSGADKATPWFDMASSDGSEVFFTDSQKLTADSSAKEASGKGEPDLYVCQMVEVEEAGRKKLKCDLTDLTPDGNPDGEPANVQGSVLAASEDGSYVYFVASGVLTGSEENGEHAKALDGEDNLYVEHYNSEAKLWEAPRFIAALSGEDYPDWKQNRLLAHTSRSSPDGRYLAFMSQQESDGIWQSGCEEWCGGRGGLSLSR